MRKQTQRSRRVVLVPCPFQGHISPMIQLGDMLHSKGFSITIVHANFNSPNPQNHSHFTFFPMPDGLSESEIAYGNPASNILEVNNNCKEFFQQFLEQDKSNENPITCIISDEVMFFCEDIACNLELPSIILRTTSAATSLARSALVRLKEEGSVSSHAVKIYRMSWCQISILRFSLSGDFGKLALLFDKLYNNRKSSAILWNTVDCLEQSILEQIQQQCQVPIFPIGPIHRLAPALVSSTSLIKEDRSCISWLDKQPHCSVIYVSSFGSLASLGEKEVAEIAWGLANSNQPFLWVIRPGSIRGSEWIELLPQGFQDAVGQRGFIVKWVPQKEVLAHEAVGGFWSHCGWNSTLESIAEGVPLICKPCFGDQLVNSRYLSHVWRVGLEFEELKRGEIERVVRKLLLEDEGKEMRKRAMEFQGKNLKFVRVKLALPTIP